MDAIKKISLATYRRSFISAWNGQAVKTFYLAFWLPVLLALWSVCLVLAWRSYPGYQMPNHDISFLGHPALNPKGWWFWSIGMGVAAIMMFPLAAYASRRMEELTTKQAHAGRRLVSLGSICLRCACFGLLGLALATQGSKLDLIHPIAGVFAFGGLYVTILFLWIMPLFNIREMSTARLTIFAVSSWWGVVGFLATQGYRFFVYGEMGRHLKHESESVFLRFSLWEWMLFVAVTTSFVILVALLPAKAKHMNNPK